MKSLTLALTVGGLLACGGARAGDVTKDDMRQVGLAYHNYFSANNKAPATADDLAPFLDGGKDEVKRLVGLLKKEQIVFIYNVGILDMEDGTSNTVLAYEREIAKSGGFALYGDGSVKTLTADEFKKAIVAKPKKKDR